MKTKVLFFVLASALLAMMVLGCDNGSEDTVTQYVPTPIYPDSIAELTVTALTGEWTNQQATATDAAHRKVTIDGTITVVVGGSSSVTTIYTPTNRKAYMQSGAIVQEVSNNKDATIDTLMIAFDTNRALTSVKLGDTVIASTTATAFKVSPRNLTVATYKGTKAAGDVTIVAAGDLATALPKVTIGTTEYSIRSSTATAPTDSAPATLVTTEGKILTLTFPDATKMLTYTLDKVSNMNGYALEDTIWSDTALDLLYNSGKGWANTTAATGEGYLKGATHVGFKVNAGTAASITTISLGKNSLTDAVAIADSAMTDAYTLMSPFVFASATNVNFLAQKGDDLVKFVITTETDATTVDVLGVFSAIKIDESEVTADLVTTT